MVIMTTHSKAQRSSEELARTTERSRNKARSAGPSPGLNRLEGRAGPVRSPFEAELVRGWLYQPDAAPVGAIALFHGAGSNCESPLLIAVAEAFRDTGWLAFRGDLPYRQERPTGPPRGNAAHDREGI